MKNSVFSNYKVFTGNSHPELAEEIASIMGKPLGKATVNKFSDGEISVNLWETVRGTDCYIVQSTCDPVNDNLMELLIMIDAMKQEFATKFKEEVQQGEAYLLAATSATAEESEKWLEDIKKAFPGMTVLYDKLSLGVSCHIGPGGLGIGCSCRPKRITR